MHVVEGEAIPATGRMAHRNLKALSIKSNGVLHELGPEINWVESFVTDDKIYCVYVAPNDEMIREHARRGGFPADSVAQVRAIIGPTTAE